MEVGLTTSEKSVLTDRSILTIAGFIRKFEAAFYFLLYVIFVWGFAYIRQDFLWINGDDPNLLQQSLLIGKGYVPNIDFFSGYPGLSLYIQAFFIYLLGPSPLAQHIYTAVLATLLGIVYFWAGKKVSPVFIFLLLLLTYSQGMLLNPTPNPGYLFDIFFLLGLCMTFHFIGNQRIVYILFAGIFFAISFLAKQYGIFGPVVFFLFTISIIRISSINKQVLLSISLFLNLIAVLYSYFGKVILSAAYDNAGILTIGEQFNILLKNSLVFSGPVLLGLISSFFIDKRPSSTDISRKSFIFINLFLCSIFIGTIFLYFYIVYGLVELPDVIYEIMIRAPTRINSNLVAVQFSKIALIKSLTGLVLMIILIESIRNSQLRIRNILTLVASLLIFCLLLRGANFSQTLFLCLAYYVVTLYWLLGSQYSHSFLPSNLTAATTPLLLILIPYPNYAYHLPILCLILLFGMSYLPSVKPIKNESVIVSALFLFVSFFIVVGVLVKSSIDISQFTRYSFGNINFVSDDPGWYKAINETNNVLSNGSNCSSYGCRYLLLAQPDFTNYTVVIEKVSRRYE